MFLEGKGGRSRLCQPVDGVIVDILMAIGTPHCTFFTHTHRILTHTPTGECLALLLALEGTHLTGVSDIEDLTEVLLSEAEAKLTALPAEAPKGTEQRRGRGMIGGSGGGGSAGLGTRDATLDAVLEAVAEAKRITVSPGASRWQLRSGGDTEAPSLSSWTLVVLHAVQPRLPLASLWQLAEVSSALASSTLLSGMPSSRLPRAFRSAFLGACTRCLGETGPGAKAGSGATEMCSLADLVLLVRGLKLVLRDGDPGSNPILVVQSIQERAVEAVFRECSQLAGVSGDIRAGSFLAAEVEAGRLSGVWAMLEQLCCEACDEARADAAGQWDRQSRDGQGEVSDEAGVQGATAQQGRDGRGLGVGEDDGMGISSGSGGGCWDILSPDAILAAMAGRLPQLPPRELAGLALSLGGHKGSGSAGTAGWNNGSLPPPGSRLEMALLGVLSPVLLEEALTRMEREDQQRRREAGGGPSLDADPAAALSAVAAAAAVVFMLSSRHRGEGKVTFHQEGGPSEANMQESNNVEEPDLGSPTINALPLNRLWILTEPLLGQMTPRQLATIAIAASAVSAAAAAEVLTVAVLAAAAEPSTAAEVPLAEKPAAETRLPAPPTTWIFSLMRALPAALMADGDGGAILDLAHAVTDLLTGTTAYACSLGGGSVLFGDSVQQSSTLQNVYVSPAFLSRVVQASAAFIRAPSDPNSGDVRAAAERAEGSLHMLSRLAALAPGRPASCPGAVELLQGWWPEDGRTSGAERDAANALCTALLTPMGGSAGTGGGSTGSTGSTGGRGGIPLARMLGPRAVTNACQVLQNLSGRPSRELTACLVAAMIASLVDGEGEEEDREAEGSKVGRPGQASTERGASDPHIRSDDALAHGSGSGSCDLAAARDAVIVMMAAASAASRQLPRKRRWNPGPLSAWEPPPPPALLWLRFLSCLAEMCCELSEQAAADVLEALHRALILRTSHSSSLPAVASADLANQPSMPIGSGGVGSPSLGPPAPEPDLVPRLLAALACCSRSPVLGTTPGSGTTPSGSPAAASAVGAAGQLDALLDLCRPSLLPPPHSSSPPPLVDSMLTTNTAVPSSLPPSFTAAEVSADGMVSLVASACRLGHAPGEAWMLELWDWIEASLAAHAGEAEAFLPGEDEAFPALGEAAAAAVGGREDPSSRDAGARAAGGKGRVISPGGIVVLFQGLAGLGLRPPLRLMEQVRCSSACGGCLWGGNEDPWRLWGMRSPHSACPVTCWGRMHAGSWIACPINTMHDFS